ncbi:hypothetical protein [Hymenobacter arizonensis]|uniref:Transposase n=1 Tax=Hymenobacter arizonensis TaxID=1227077 RepID=A0A1I6A7Y6_HYMAR|nr:hypothetical protein [Hymenobacter arizonensis]SFQ64788.1 hypothetical protein SAMN04515668_3399 [Hymenobacter arizonensis]
MTPKRTRRRYTAEFKAEVGLAALTERQPLAKLAARYQLATAQITRWTLQLRQQAAQVFAEARAAAAVPDVEPLYAAISRLQTETALLKKRWAHVNNSAARPGGAGRSGQVRAGALPSAGPRAQEFYCQPGGERAENLLLMRLLDEEFTQQTFKGVLDLRDHLRLAGHAVNEKARAPARAPDGPRAGLPPAAPKKLFELAEFEDSANVGPHYPGIGSRQEPVIFFR